MPRKFDKATRARVSHAEKARELTIAIRQSNRILARNFILKDKIRITNVTKQEYDRFFKVAVKAGDTPLVRTLLEFRPQLNATFGAHLLWKVIGNTDTRIAEMLVRAGADVNNAFDRKSSFLHVLAKSTCPKKIELGLLMMKYGANIHVPDVYGDTVLDEALFSDNHVFAQELLKRGAVIDDAILWTVIDDTRDPIKSLLLLVNGYHVKDTNKRAELVARIFESLCEFDIPQSTLIDMTKALFDLEIPDVHVILHAARYKNIGLMKSLFESADIDRRIKMTFLHCAATDGQSSEMAEALIQWGADIEYPVDLEIKYFVRGTRPLHVACRYNSLKSIQLLLQCGADVNAIDDDGNTPFSFVADHVPCIHNLILIKHFALLTSKGATVNERDLSLVMSQPAFKQFYDDYSNELKVMKTTVLFSKRISFYSIITESPKKMVTLMRRKKFSYEYLDKRNIFPLYQYDLDLRFAEANRLKNLLMPKEKAFYEAMYWILPENVIDLIVHYVYLNDVDTLAAVVPLDA